MDKIEIIPPTSSLLRAYKDTKFLARVTNNDDYANEAEKLKASIAVSVWIDMHRLSMREFGRFR